MQEDLLGYLLNALEPDEMRRVELWLRGNEEAQRELARLERTLGRLDENEPAEDLSASDLMPPADLVSRTLANLPPMPPMPEAEKPDDSFEVADVEARIFSNLSFSEVSEGGSSSAWSLRDWAASVTAAVILIAISVPALSEGRFAARKVACQDHLRELGLAMTQFAGRNAQSRLPSVAPDGYQAFAGVYALRLHEAGLLNDPRITLCPSIDRAAFWPIESRPGSGMGYENPLWLTDDSQTPMLVSLQTLDELGRDLAGSETSVIGDSETAGRVMRAIEKLRWIQMTAGGQYAYTLGVRDGEHFSPPRFQGRTHFAVMSDAAITRVQIMDGPLSSDSRSGNLSSGYRSTVLSHGGRGINVLYEDGHVGFLPTDSLDRIPDNPLVNHDGLNEAGVTIDDASLAPSWRPPFLRASQR